MRYQFTRISPAYTTEWQRNREISHKVEIPFELEVLRCIIAIVGSIQKYECSTLQKKVMDYLEDRRIQRESRSVLLDMSIEVYAKKLKIEAYSMQKTINSNVTAIRRVMHDQDNCKEYYCLLQLSVFQRSPELYDDANESIR